MASIKKNILLNGINTVSGIIYPIITFPYAARVLLPEGIGAVNFLNSIISYIILLTSLGIPLYAVKEIARHGDNKYERDKTAVEILLLSTFLCLLGYLAVWLLGEYVPQIHKQLALFYVLSLSILFTAIGSNWFYQGIEDFKFITIRAVIIRTVAAVSLFLFVKTQADLIIYGLIVVGSTVGNNLINFLHLQKHIDYKVLNFKQLDVFSHLLPSLHIFILNLIISLYIQLNSIMLGFLVGDEAVGFFTAGTRISHIGLTIIASIGTVMLPRVSQLLKKGDINSFNVIIHKSLDVTLASSWPMMIGLSILATPITIIFCGPEYISSVPVLILNTPVILFISLTNIMGIQILYPYDRVNLVIYSVMGGALVNFVLNIILIPSLAATGAAISTLIAEFTVLILQLILGKSYYPFSVKNLIGIRYIISSVIMGLAVWISIFKINNYWGKISVGISIGIITYLGMLVFFRDPLVLSILKKISRRNH